jgi:4-amino-4-deoxy-L-arabinose transferase-like glycosyltransferase
MINSDGAKAACMSKSFGKILILCLLAILVLARFVSLDLDPPLFYMGHGQSQLTDPYHLTHFARNRVLFDDWDPFDYHRWDLFKTSVVSGCSYIIFSLFGVSRATANLAAVLLQSGGILFLLLGLYQFRPGRETLIAAGIILINSTLFFYGRLPFLENGLIFLSGLAFYIFTKYHSAVWGQVLTGILVSLAALAGKLFGFILLGPVVIALVYRYRGGAAKPILFTLGGLILGSVLYLFALFHGKLSVLLNYYAEQTTGMYGSPPGFTSVANFFKMLLTYGGESGLSEYTPLFVLMTAVALIFVTLSEKFREKFRDEHMPLLFMFAWLICGVLGLMPFQYRPLRYGIFLFLPASAICAYVITAAAEKSLKLRPKWMPVSLILTCMSLWFVFTQIRIYFSPFGEKFKSGVEVIPIAFLAALVITVIMYFGLRRERKTFINKAAAAFFILLLAAYVLHQGTYLYRGLAHPGDYLSRTSREISTLLGEEAVITGPYGATLTVDNETRNVIYMFGLADVERHLFNRYPITHIATDNTNWRLALKDFPFLKSAVRIVGMQVRDIIIDIYRIRGAAGAPTDFERGSLFLSLGKADSAYQYFNIYCEKSPASFFGKTHLAYAALVKGSTEESLEIVDELIKDYPEDYLLHGFCKAYYRKLYDLTGEEKYRRLSEHHELEVKRLK